MDLWDLAKLMWRRWFLMVPMIVLTITLTTWAIVTIEPDYTSTGTIILVPPADKTPLTTAELASTNTWVELGEDVMAQAIAISVRTKATREEVAKDGLNPDYEVEAESRSNLITITATAGTPELAQATVQRVEKQIATEVEQKQAVFRPKPGRSISTQVLDAGDTIEVVNSKIKRAAVVILGAGLLLTAAVTIVGDLLLRRRAMAVRGGHRAPAVQAPGGDEPLDAGGARSGSAGLAGQFGSAGVGAFSSDDTTAIPSTRVPPDVNVPATAGPAGPAGSAGTSSAVAEGAASGINRDTRTRAGASLAVNYRQADADGGRRPTEPDDATIVLPLSGSPWAGREGRDNDAAARKR